MTTPKLDILISTYGEEGLARIADHKHPRMEGVRYIVAAQGLPEKYLLPERLRESDFKVVESPGKGLSRNRNFSLSLAEAPLAMIADDDLDFEPRYFNAIFKAYNDNPAADAIFFTYESADYPKNYPSHSYDFSDGIPKGYFVTSFEITFRTQRIKGNYRFDEKFGIGSRFPSGEEDLFVDSLRRGGLTLRFESAPIARHDGSTTSDRVMNSPSFIRTRGAVIRRIHPKTWILRMFPHALRHVKANSSACSVRGFLSYLKYWLEGGFDKF